MNLRFIKVASLFIALMGANAQRREGSGVMTGVWQGELNVQQSRLRLRLEIASDGKATIVSLDQGGIRIPIDECTATSERLIWRATKLGMAFEGVATSGGFDGVFKQGRLEQALRLIRASKPIRRPQDPTPPFPYRQEDVSFPSKEQSVSLAGTLTIPQGSGPFPAVVLLSGSGPQDRDHSMFDHRPFAVLADRLARAGFAALRFDDRGVGGSGGSLAQATLQQGASDAEGALEFLKKDNRRIGPIGFVGYSEGGLIAPMIASRRPEVAFLILLAAPGVPGDALLLAQGEALVRAAGGGDDAVNSQRALQTALFSAAKETSNFDEIVRRVTEKIGPVAGVEQGARQVSSPAMQMLLKHDPAGFLARVKCPVLALNGSLDRQVVAAQNLPAIEQALRRGRNNRVTTRLISDANHLFQTARTGSISEYEELQETISLNVLDVIEQWLRELRLESQQ